MDETSAPAAGWYKHPEMADTKRYWDGSSWTQHITADMRPAAELGPVDTKYIAQAERVVGAINVVKWLLIVLIALSALALVLAIANGAFVSSETSSLTEDAFGEPTTETDGVSFAAAAAASGAVVAVGFFYALLIWIVLGWAQHALSMLAILARNSRH